jgi:hypothetical protein
MLHETYVRIAGRDRGVGCFTVAPTAAAARPSAAHDDSFTAIQQCVSVPGDLARPD